MEECGFYEQDKVSVASEENSPTRQQLHATRFHLIPWCGHPKHSPVSREEARIAAFDPPLKCRGVLENCPIRDRYVDVI